MTTEVNPTNTLELMIEGVPGGYILSYATDADEEPKREIQVNARKLMKRVQELLEQNVGNK